MKSKSSKVVVGSLIFFVVGFLLGQLAKNFNITITPSVVRNVFVKETPKTLGGAMSLTKSMPPQLPVAVVNPQAFQARKKILEENNLGLLYQRLFEEKEIENEYKQSNFLPDLKERFKKPYPNKSKDEKDLNQDEFLIRVGILKALDQIKGPQILNDKEIKSFYRELTLSKNEEWLVKRQALRNLRRWLASEDQAAVKSYFLKLDQRLLQTAGLSEREILEGLLEK